MSSRKSMSIRHTVRRRQAPNQRPSTPIRWTHVLAGFAVNVLVVTLSIAGFADMPYGLLVALAGPIIMGAAFSFVVSSRQGVHAFLAGMLSIPFLAFFVLPDQLSWIFAVLAGGLFALAGLVVDLIRRAGRRVDRP